MNSSRSTLKCLLGTVALLAVASAAHANIELNLTARTLDGIAPSNVGTINGAIYEWTPSQPTGTGYIDPFVRVGMNGAAGEQVVQAYNTRVNGVFDNSNDDTYNHEVSFGQLGTTTIGGVEYVKFLLDINQNSGQNGELLSLDEVQIFISSSKNQSVESFKNDSSGLVDLASSSLVYRMDGPGDPTTPSCNGTGPCDPYPNPDITPDNRVVLDYSRNSGSGSGDMFLYVKVSDFLSAGATASSWVYLYSRFGSDPYINNDGFEEWSFFAKDGGGGGGGGAPEPSTMLLAGLAIVAASTASKRRKA